MTGVRRANRGPSAAQANRQALVTAAIEVFAEGGIDAPLSSVAKKAGVGQGSLYRHFPDRISLALAVFEKNVAELEGMEGSSLSDLLAVITRQTLDSIAFVDIVTASGADARVTAVAERVKNALIAPLRAAQRAKTIRESLTVDDLMLAIGMVAALVAKMPPAARHQTASDAWNLLDRAMRP